MCDFTGNELVVFLVGFEPVFYALLSLVGGHELQRIDADTLRGVSPLHIEKEEVKFDQLPKELSQKMKENDQDYVYLRADEEIKYGSVARLMSYLKSRGFIKISLFWSHYEDLFIKVSLLRSLY